MEWSLEMCILGGLAGLVSFFIIDVLHYQNYVSFLSRSSCLNSNLNVIISKLDRPAILVCA